MNAEILNAIQSAIAKANVPEEVPQGPVRFKYLALEKFGDSEPVITGFHPETGATTRFEDQSVLEDLIALGAKPSQVKTVEVDTEDGPKEVVRRRIDGFAVEAAITGLTRKTSKSGKTRVSATVKDIKVVKSGLELDGDWAL